MKNTAKTFRGCIMMTGISEVKSVCEKEKKRTKPEKKKFGKKKIRITQEEIWKGGRFAY